MTTKLLWPAKAKKFYIPMFGVRVYLTTDRATYDRCMAVIGDHRTSGPGSAGKCAWVEGKSEGTSDFILLGVFNKRPSTLVHELAHACFFACEILGVPVERGKHNETYCYMLDRLFDMMLPHLKAKK